MLAAAAIRTEATRGATRSCASCRTSAPARELLRIVCGPEGELIVDWRRNLGGRGANLCPTRSCVETAIRRRSLDRVLKRTVVYPEAEILLGAARGSLLRSIETLLRSCKGASALAVGSDQARAAVFSGKAAGLLTARDSTSAVAIAEAAMRAGVPTASLPTKTMLGDMMDRRPTGVVAIRDRGLATALVGATKRLEALK